MNRTRHDLPVIRARSTPSDECVADCRLESVLDPVGLPVASYSRRNYAPVVYQKGPLYFHDLRLQVGEDAFWEILRTYFERHRYGIARPQDWLAAVESETGSPYQSLYDEWILDVEH